MSRIPETGFIQNNFDLTLIRCVIIIRDVDILLIWSHLDYSMRFSGGKNWTKKFQHQPLNSMLKGRNSVFYERMCNLWSEVTLLHSCHTHVRSLPLYSDYNNILRAISSEERKLFSERVRSLDQKIQPGLGKLTWASQGVVENFVHECRKHASEINKVLSHYAIVVHPCWQTLLCRLWSNSRKVVHKLEIIVKVSVRVFWSASRKRRFSRIGSLKRSRRATVSWCVKD